VEREGGEREETRKKDGRTDGRTEGRGGEECSLVLPTRTDERAQALVLAGRVATLSVQAKGTQSSFPTLATLPPDLHP
jgi:hypothetical protein